MIEAIKMDEAAHLSQLWSLVLKWLGFKALMKHIYIYLTNLTS